MRLVLDDVVESVRVDLVDLLFLMMSGNGLKVLLEVRRVLGRDWRMGGVLLVIVEVMVRVKVEVVDFLLLLMVRVMVVVLERLVVGERESVWEVLELLRVSVVGGRSIGFEDVVVMVRVEVVVLMLLIVKERLVMVVLGVVCCLVMWVIMGW